MQKAPKDKLLQTRAPKDTWKKFQQLRRFYKRKTSWVLRKLIDDAWEVLQGERK